MTTYRLMDGVAGRPGVGSTGATPPSAGTSYSGNYLAGIVFQVTSGGMWFQGYWWWVPSTISQTGAQKFALWQVDGSAAGTLVANSTVTSGTLTAGAWNFVALSTPLLLPPGIIYTAATGFVSTTGFPDSQNRFGSGESYAAGITNGPLNAFSSYGGSAPVPGDWQPQSPFGTGGSDPSLTMPVTNDQDDILWLDVQVTDTAPSGASYRTWPNMPSPIGISVPSTSNDYTLAMQFSLSASCTLDKIWHYSPVGSVVLPSRCGIWNVSTTTEVAGTDNSSPAWKDPSGATAAAGDGWVYCDYSSSGVTLSSGVNYKVSTFYGASTTNKWLAVTTGYWTTGGPGVSGFTMGPLSVPNSAGASPGQDSWNNGSTWVYPGTSTSPENDWIDVEVTPAGGTPHTATAHLTVTPSISAIATRTAASHTATAHLTVTPVITAHATRTAASHTATAHLTVTPGITAHATRTAASHTATAHLVVTPVLTAVATRTAASHTASAHLVVTPVLTASATRTAASHTATAHLTVTPVISATATRTAASHTATAHLIVTPVITAAATKTSATVTATAHLVVIPVLTAVATRTAASHAATAHLVVTPVISATASRTAASHTATAHLIVTPVITAHAAKAGNHTATAHLVVTPVITAQGHTPVAHTATAHLVVTPGRVVTDSHRSHIAAPLFTIGDFFTGWSTGAVFTGWSMGDLYLSWQIGALTA